jgi:UDP-N-acetyl-D-glucosamine/UDP-N-acetyl-D-galactosamine dehydrogenase
MNDKICVVGMGYVGLPLAIEFAKKCKVVGFDVVEDKIEKLKQGIDPTHEVGDEEVKKSSMEFTCDEKKINECDFIIVAVPTPIDENNVPDLKYVKSASEIVGKNMKKGAIVVYESTVYPGCTEDDCLPLLEKYSGLKLGEFGLGYSPERINPGDKEHRVDTIVKVVSGNNKEVLEKVAEVYSLIIKAGVHKASSIKVAESAKVIENVQRDLNIALMNELSIIFEKMNINTNEVIEAAATKWNFHKYTPGLVGGHCISIDPYYLTFKAQKLGYKPEVILAGRRINDNMHKQVAYLVEKSIEDINNKKILIMGLTFKENVPDYRNSRAKQLIETLKEKGALVYGYDPYLDKKIIENEFKAKFVEGINEKYDAIVLFSPHELFEKDYDKIKGILIDVKGTLRKNEMNVEYYCL